MLFKDKEFFDIVKEEKNADMVEFRLDTKDFSIIWVHRREIPMLKQANSAKLLWDIYEKKQVVR